MLTDLRIKDFALIDELIISFAPCLNVITGETGAGKSIIIEAINLLVGGRADPSRVRETKESAVVEGLFTLDDGREFVLRRVISRDGKGRAMINGELATVGRLGDLSAELLDLHGQHEHQSLLKPSAQLEYLDRFAGAGAAAAKENLKVVSEEHGRLSRQLAALRDRGQDAVVRKELLEWQINELTQAELRVGEDSDLEVKIERLKSAANLSETISRAVGLLDEQGVDAVQGAEVELSRAINLDSGLTPILSLITAASANLVEATRDLRAYLEALDCDRGRLDDYQGRLFALKDLKKKYGLSIEELLQKLDAARSEIAGLADVDGDRERLTAAVDELAVRKGRAAADLSRERAAAAVRFGALVEEQLRQLALAHGAFKVKLANSKEDGNGGPGGDRIDFVFTANPGHELKSLSKVGSGGELSRVMLALRTVLGAADTTPTLVFDEIDAGIGGKTAVKVGEHLAALAGAHQVICVTHLAQIAAFADNHISVQKISEAGQTCVGVTVLSGEERLTELTRLGGALAASTAAVAHARQLLDQASSTKDNK